MHFFAALFATTVLLADCGGDNAPIGANTCRLSFDGVCDEPQGYGVCAPYTDTTDCMNFDPQWGACCQCIEGIGGFMWFNGFLECIARGRADATEFAMNLCPECGDDDE